MALDEVERSPPGIVGRLGELVLLAVEEAVRRALVGDDLVLDAGGLEGLRESGDVGRRHRLIGAAHQSEDRCPQLTSALGPAGQSVEADRARERLGPSGGKPRPPAAEAEADREEGRAGATLG